MQNRQPGFANFVNVDGSNLAVAEQSIIGNAVSQQSLDPSGPKCRYKTHRGILGNADDQVTKTTTVTKSLSLFD